MAACAISNTTSSAWCAKSLMEREVLWKMAPHIIHGRCVSSCPIAAAASETRLAAQRIGLFLYDHIGGRKLLPADAEPWICCTDPAGQAAQAACYEKPSSIPTAGWTMRGWWSSTRGTRPIAARKSCGLGARMVTGVRTKAAASGSITIEMALSGSPPRRCSAQASRQCRWPVGRSCRVERAARSQRRHATCGWCKAATSWCGASSTIRAPTSSRTGTGASSSRSRMKQDFTLIGTTDQDFRDGPG
jgi:hypothetical protein